MRIGFVLAFALGACAAHPQQWTKPGATADDFVRDQARCNMGRVALPPATGFEKLGRDMQYMHDCLVAAGYTPTQ